MKPIVFSRHAREQMQERGASETEVVRAVRDGLPQSARKGRVFYRLNLPYNAVWAGKRYAIKQVAPVVAEDADRLVVVTVYTFYF
jgi:hypothetical protein